jgi:hypothetical protein
MTPTFDEISLQCVNDHRSCFVKRLHNSSMLKRKASNSRRAKPRPVPKRNLPPHSIIGNEGVVGKVTLSRPDTIEVEIGSELCEVDFFIPTHADRCSYPTRRWKTPSSRRCPLYDPVGLRTVE